MPRSLPDSTDLQARIEAALDEVRPYLVADGGGCELVEVSDDGSEIVVRLTGACGTCASSAMTVKMGIERHLREHVPEVRQVRAVGSGAEPLVIPSWRIAGLGEES